MASPSRPVVFGPGKASDRPALFHLLLKERLNCLSPFICDVRQSMIVARDAATGTVVGGAKLGKLGDRSYELSSVVVDAAYRGRGVGKELIRRALDLAPDSSSNSSSSSSNTSIYLTTLKDRRGLYEPFGFREISRSAESLPLALAVEMAVGAAVFKAVDLIAMRKDPK